MGLEGWDGYQAQRQRILQHAYDQEWNNTVMVTGDTHASWLFENNLNNVLVGTNQANSTLAYNGTAAGYKRGQIVEFAGSAVSSNGWGASWLNEKNSTASAASKLVQNSGSLFWSEGFCEYSRLSDYCSTDIECVDRGYMNVYISYDNITTEFFGYPNNQGQSAFVLHL